MKKTFFFNVSLWTRKMQKSNPVRIHLAEKPKRFFAQNSKLIKTFVKPSSIFLLKMKFWTFRMQLWQTPTKFLLTKAWKFFAQCLKALKKLRRIFPSKYLPGHLECNSDNPLEKIRRKAEKVLPWGRWTFAQRPNMLKRDKSFCSKKVSQSVLGDTSKTVWTTMFGTFAWEPKMLAYSLKIIKWSKNFPSILNKLPHSVPVDI